MLEILQFVFSSFWIWLGTVILIGALGNVIASFIALARGKKVPR
jgi:ABC-type multidrug transport system permease subunit